MLLLLLGFIYFGGGGGCFVLGFFAQKLCSNNERHPRLNRKSTLASEHDSNSHFPQMGSKRTKMPNKYGRELNGCECFLLMMHALVNRKGPLLEKEAWPRKDAPALTSAYENRFK